MLYSDNSVQNPVGVTEDLSKCSIKEIEKPHMDRTTGMPMTRLPIQVPQGNLGVSFLSFCNYLACITQ